MSKPEDMTLDECETLAMEVERRLDTNADGDWPPEAARLPAIVLELVSRLRRAESEWPEPGSEAWSRGAR